jgi:hypothetical protein
MRGISLRLALILGGLTCFLAPAALAPRLSLESLTDRSPVIVEGRVIRSWVAWGPAHRYIWTHYGVAVTDSLRGGTSDVTVSEPGGSLDGVNQRFSGSLHYDVGEHVVLFLFRTPVGYWRTTGGSQGKFAVSRDSRVRQADGNTAMPTARMASTRELLSERQRIFAKESNLADFKSLVRSLARARIADEVR